jgi:imidazole glycerol-phosphate synthase subunit HisH
MSVDVAIVDYGIGNLFSVRQAFEHCGANVLVSDDPTVLLAAPRLVLPGVGAFADGMRGLIERKLDKVVLEFANSGKPLLGICLGMQMLASFSEEFGEHKGLGIIPGRVIPIPNTTADGKPHKIPHVGWASLDYPNGLPGWQGSILETLSPGDAVYLVHSFAVQPDESINCLADCNYNGRIIAAAIRKGNVYGTQFHPEKSGLVGMKILKHFL